MSITKRIPIAIGIKPNQQATFTNKTIDCSPGNGNTISNIPNSSLVNNSITINGNVIPLGGQGSITLSGAEIDPIFSASPSSSITSGNISNWNTAYGWGNHASQGYLTSYIETDPIFSASEAASITSSDTTNWNTAYGWGNHASQGYLTSIPPTSRESSQATTPNIANNTSTNLTINAAKTFALLKVQTSHAAWITIYTDPTSRTNDSSRLQSEDPLSGSGVLAEVITSGASSQIITPGTFCWNNDATPNENIYLKVHNNSGSNASITVTLTFVALEG